MKMYKVSNNRIIIPLYTKNNILSVMAYEFGKWSQLTYDSNFMFNIKNNYGMFENEIPDKEKLIKRLMD